MNKHAEHIPKVLYIINTSSEMSIPLEIAGFLHSDNIRLIVVVYYASIDIPTTDLSFPVIQIKARGAFDLKALYTVYTLISREQPDIIHVHHTLSAIVGSIIGRLKAVPIIVKTEHRDHHTFHFGQHLLNVFTIFLADAIICNSDYTNRSFRWWERLFALNKRVTIYNGVDLQKIERCKKNTNLIRSEIGISEGDFLIGTVGRLIEIKDHITLLQAMAIVAKESPHSKLVIVGTGHLQRTLATEVTSLGLQTHVIFTGGVSRRRVYEILHTLDLFVMTSLSEGFCNAAVEAMAAAKPVLSSRAGALPEVLGDTCRFVPLRSPEKLGKAILEMTSLSSEELARLGRVGRGRAETHFTIERTAESYQQLYQQLLTQKGIVHSNRNTILSREK